MIEHCISSFKNKQEEKAYKIYMSDIGFQLANAFGKVFGSKEDLIKKRFIDCLEPPKEVKETEEDVIARIRKKLEG